MKKILLIALSLILALTLPGCNTNNTDTNSAQIKNDDALYLKAIDILDDFGEDQRIKDFRKAYDLLMTLPAKEDKFISQLNEARKVFEKYDSKFKYGDIYLSPYREITQEDINKYRTQGAYYDADNLMQEIVYPVLFEKYGNEAQSIKGIVVQDIKSLIQYTYTLDKKTEQYDVCREEWKNKATPQLKYEITYHSNGLVERLNVPFVMSEDPLSDEEITAFFEKDLTEQKAFASERFQSMLDQITESFMGYEVLSKIFSDEEILVIVNYIQSLTVEEIWEKDIYHYYGANASPIYSVAAVYFDYNDVMVSISMGLNKITLDISGKNPINSLSSNWVTLWCGMCLPEGDHRDETIDGYKDILNNNVEANSVVPDWSFDLAANAHKYKDLSTDDDENEAEPIDMPFFIHSSFSSEHGNELFVNYQDGIYTFLIDEKWIGSTNTWYVTESSAIFKIETNTGSYLIFCYPNDEYVEVQVLDSIDTSLAGAYFP